MPKCRLCICEGWAVYLYADYNFTKAAEEVFSLPQAKPFLESLKHKYKEIGEEMSTNEIYVRIPDDGVISQIQLGKEGSLIKLAINKFLGKSKNNKPEESSLLEFPEMQKKSVELTEINLAALARRKSELHAKMEVTH